MPTNIVVVEHKRDWPPVYPDVDVLLGKAYLANIDLTKKKGLRVINLCRSYRYLSIGYYCSLLAEARGHRVLPSVRTITDLSRKAIYSVNIEPLDAQVNHAIKRHRQHLPDQSTFELDVYFGVAENPDFQDLARLIFDLFPCPLLRIDFKWQGTWSITSIKPLSLHSLPDEKRQQAITDLTALLGKRWRRPRQPQVSKFDLAILYNPKEKLPPSNKGALNRFMTVGKRLGINVELLERKDYHELAEFDALFIRETTAINHHTYTFAKKAEAEGMVVIDDPDSIVKCTNKVYLFELLSSHKIPVPNTRVLTADDLKNGQLPISYPAVIKIPDGSFSRGVYKAQNEAEAREIAARLLKESEIIIAQEFMYTDFDWRIGILNHEVLYACQYFMSKAHWQILKHDAKGHAEEGDYATWELERVPPGVLQTALAAAKLIGDGLYGVDLKATDRGIFVIEVNDNPNLETGVEDGMLGDKLYEIILSEFRRRVELRRGL